LTAIVHEVECGTTIHITRRGKPAAVLLSEKSYARLIADRLTFSEAYATWREGSEEAGVARSHFDSVRDRGEGRPVKL
jgi:prevent-host-death family protein